MKLGPVCFDEDMTLLFAWTIGKTVAKVAGPFRYAFTGLIIGEHMIGTMRRVRTEAPLLFGLIAEDSASAGNRCIECGGVGCMFCGASQVKP